MIFKVHFDSWDKENKEFQLFTVFVANIDHVILRNIVQSQLNDVTTP